MDEKKSADPETWFRTCLKCHSYGIYTIVFFFPKGIMESTRKPKSTHSTPDELNRSEIPTCLLSSQQWKIAWNTESDFKVFRISALSWGYLHINQVSGSRCRLGVGYFLIVLLKSEDIKGLDMVLRVAFAQDGPARQNNLRQTHQRERHTKIWFKTNLKAKVNDWSIIKFWQSILKDKTQCLCSSGFETKYRIRNNDPMKDYCSLVPESSYTVQL